MKENIQYECLHCGKKNPENLAYKGANCCNECLKDLKYYVVYDNDNGFVERLTIALTKKSAQKFISYDDIKRFYLNLRIVSCEEYDKLKLIKDIHYCKQEIISTTQRLKRLKTELKIKESILRGSKK